MRSKTMKYLEFERAVRRRVVNRYDLAEHSLAILLLSVAASAVLIVFLLVVELVERLAGVLL